MYSSRKTKKSKSKNKYSVEQVILYLLSILTTVKIYHWKTTSYAQHKSTDQLYSELNENIDKFVEVLLGITQTRANLTNTKSLPINDYSSLPPFTKKINEYILYLQNMPFKDTDLLNIRDEVLGNLNQFKYLLTFD
jgi:DNA-binding ferritin-like protein